MIESEQKGGSIQPKTDVTVQLTGQDGNVFNVIGQVSKALKRGGHRDLAQEFTERAFKAESYNAVLRLCMEYVDVT